MSRHKVEICGVNTAKIKVLKNDEMVKLFKELKKGNLKAKENLINGNLKLVLSILKKYVNRTDNMDDLFQIGCIGLIKAIDNFDLAHEVKFSTYAVPMILGEIKRYLRDNNSVRIARSIKDNAYKALKIREELTNSLGREPTAQQIADIMELPIYEVKSALESMHDSISIFEPIYNDGGDTIYLADQLADKKEKYDVSVKLALKEALKKIKQKEKYIIIARFINGKTQMELSEELGISQAQISRLEKNGLDTLRRMID
jgi:RNA polymerase sporulation-specific sigma factor